MAASDGWIPTARAWLATFDEIAPNAIEGLYVVGSAALNDWQDASSDIDIVAITAEPADEDMVGTLGAAHAVFVERYPTPNVDGPFLAWGDLVVPPQGITRPWTLDGDYRHDAECFEINPVTWFTLARHGVTVRGAEPREIPIPTDLDERVRFVVDNASSYWTSVLAELRGALGELADEATLPSSVPVWCLLGVCRMLYTATTGDVTSKSGAGRWAAGVLGAEFVPACETAVRLRGRVEEPVGVDVLRDTADAMAEVLRRLRIMVR